MRSQKKCSKIFPRQKLKLKKLSKMKKRNRRKRLISIRRRMTKMTLLKTSTRTVSITSISRRMSTRCSIMRLEHGQVKQISLQRSK